MRFEVLVESYNSLIEEEIDIRINTTRLNCFMSCGTDFWIEEGEKYCSEIESIIFDKPIINEIQVPMKEIQCNARDFSHKVCGRLNIDKGIIQSSIDIDVDQAYLYDYAYLDGKFVEITIDRFDIEFYPQISGPIAQNI